MKANKQKMDEIFEELNGELPVSILLHNSPDPDCMGAAAGIVVLLKHSYGLTSKIYHFGEVSHPMNKCLKNVLHIQLNSGDDFEPDQTSAVVVLDTDLTATSFKEKVNKADVRIDHHHLERDSDPRFSDIRAVGSTCAIVWEYLKEFNIPMADNSNAATAMVLGITTDTKDFTSEDTTELDMTAYRELLPFVNRESLAKVNAFELPKILFKIEANAFQSREIKNSSLVASIGEQGIHNRDIIPMIADRFVRMVGINTVFIMGIIENNLVVSIRSGDNRVDVGEVCVKVFGKGFSGSKEGGGSGGARVPLNDLFKYIHDAEVRAGVVEQVFSSFKTKIFAVLGEEVVEEDEKDE
jgi:nanoRNase/pAp phosphatase (c-di-AMP/oligoRNAs hydrolase)